MNITSKSAHGLFWFRHDCRTIDMPALSLLCKQVDTLMCVYILDENEFEPSDWCSAHMGEKRWEFIRQGLTALDQQLKLLGNQLVVIKTEKGLSSKWDRANKISQLITQFNISHLGVSEHCGYYEQRDIAYIKAKNNAELSAQSANENRSLNIITGVSGTLYCEQELPFPLKDMPDTFSAFRRQVEAKDYRAEPVCDLSSLPSMQKHIEAKLVNTIDTIQHENVSNGRFTGGTTPALNQLEYYLFETDHIATYKDTRNAMVGWHVSTKFSAWLANGNISAKIIMQRLQQYERERTKNNSTYWVFFELLWREFFIGK